ncbi:MAG: hypothetical protein O3C40_02950 [Planctomycetota bacterium]|nr:hypothetical protein [Planctomycetota bacterium]
MAKSGAQAKGPKPTRQRSPNYPAIGLRTAVEKVKLLYDKYGREKVPLKLACEAMGHKTLNSLSQQYVAALKAYSLILTYGTGDERRAAVSEAAERIVRNAPNRAELLKTAAVAPTIHAEVWDHYEGRGLPHDDLLKQYLVWDRPDGSRFTEDAVDGFIERFRDTLDFSEVAPGDKLSDNEQVDSGDENGNGCDSGGEDEETNQHIGAPKNKRQERRQVIEGVKEATYPMATGEIFLQWPCRISAEEAEDIVDWLAIMTRKIKRSVVSDEPEEPEGDS